jgi:hypothetical protein
VNIGAGEVNDTISIGRALLNSLWLRKEGNDLLLRIAGPGDALRLEAWYLGIQTVSRLQVVVDSSGEYAAGSADTLRNSRVLGLDFTQLVGAFNAARTANPSLVDWQLTDARLLPARTGGSDSQAVGGHLAYRHAQDGTLSSVQYENGIGQLAAAGFGNTMQDILLGTGGLAQGLSALGADTDAAGLAVSELAAPADAEAVARTSDTAVLPQVDALPSAPLPSAVVPGTPRMLPPPAVSVPAMEGGSVKAPIVARQDAAQALATTDVPAASQDRGSSPGGRRVAGAAPSIPAEAAVPPAHQPLEVGTPPIVNTPEAPAAWLSFDWTRLDMAQPEPAAASPERSAGVVGSAVRWSEVDAWIGLQHALGGRGLEADLAAEQDAIRLFATLGSPSGGSASLQGGLQAPVARLEQVARLAVADMMA